MHYDDVKKDRQCVAKYMRWEHELVFDGIDIDVIDIRHDVAKLERLNNIKVNVHAWAKGLKGMRYNSRKNTTPRTVNLLLVVNEEGDQHYCGIPKLNKLYHHTRKSLYGPHVNAAYKHSKQKKHLTDISSGAVGGWRK